MVEPIDIRTGKPFASRRPHLHHPAPPSECASLGGNLGRARGLMGGCFMGTMMASQSHGPTPWVNPYVTDGLVAMWDGEWNTGVGGIHSATATSWTDLVSQRVMSLNVDATTNCVFEANYLTDTNNAAKPYGYAPMTGLGTVRTIEEVFKQRTYQGGYRCHVLCGSVISLMMMEDSGWFAFRWSIKSGKAWKAGASSLMMKKMSAVSICDMSLTDNGYPATFNGAGTSLVSGNGEYSITNDYIYLNGGPHLVSAKVDYYCIRMYDRLLSDSERNTNYDVDAERFGLPARAS